MATSAAEAELTKRARGETKLRFSMAGHPLLTAESNLIMDGTFRAGIAGEWLITRVRHSVSPSGYTTDVEAEKPNSDPSVKDAIHGNAADMEEPT